MQISLAAQLTISDPPLPDLTISLSCAGPVVQNVHQGRILLQSATATLWSPADPSSEVKTLGFLVVYTDQEIDLELGVDRPAPATIFTWTIRVEPGAPVVLLSPVSMPGPLGTAPLVLTRLRAQESHGKQAMVRYVIG